MYANSNWRKPLVIAASGHVPGFKFPDTFLAWSESKRKALLLTAYFPCPKWSLLQIFVRLCQTGSFWILTSGGYILSFAKHMDGVDKSAEYLSLVSGYFYRRLRYQARDLGLRWTALMVMTDLRHMGPSSQKTLAMVEQMSEPTMTVLIRQLIKDGLVTRTTHDTDGRIKLVSLTEKGARVLKESGEHLRACMKKELSSLSATQYKALERALEPLVGNIMADIAAVSGLEVDNWGDRIEEAADEDH